MRSRQADGRLLSAGALVLALLAGCGGEPAEQPWQPNAVEPPLASAPPVTSAASVALPLDRYGLTAEQRTLEAKARDLIIRDCMNLAGETWLDSVQAEFQATNVMIGAMRAARFGLIDDAEAAQFGYRGDPAAQPPQEAEQPGSAAFGECAKEAKLKLGQNAPPAADFALSFRLPEEAAARVLNDSRYRSMVEQWRVCMKAAGYPYDSPADAAKDTNWTSAKPSNIEIQTARADVKCKSEVGYLNLVVALRIAYERQLVEENAEAMQRLKIYYEDRSRLIVDLVNGAVGK